MNGQQYEGASTEVKQDTCGILTLDPLSTDGPDALDTHDVPGLAKAKATLCEVEILSRNSRSGAIIWMAKDLFAEGADLWAVVIVPSAGAGLVGR